MSGKATLPPLEIPVVNYTAPIEDDFLISLRKLCRLFPFYLIVNQNFEIMQIGKSWINNEISLIGCRMDHFFEFLMPNSEVDWNNLKLREDEDVLIRTKFGGSTLESELFSGGIQRLPANLCDTVAATERDSCYIFLIYPVRKDSFSYGHSLPGSRSSYTRDLSLYNVQREDETIRSIAEITEKLHSKDSLSQVTIGDDLNPSNPSDQKKEEEEEKTEKAIKQRDIIANVAHDLKTPLAAFLSGVEVISEIAEEGIAMLKAFHEQIAAKDQEKDHQKEETNFASLAEQYSDRFQQIFDQSTQMKFITNFMTASINRCIDFGKANHGIKLIPKNETFVLAETILLPIRVMQTSQEKVKISLRPVADNICTDIISDQQWLQENILCLLSNAVKYSHRGEVTMSVYLHSLKSSSFQKFDNERVDNQIVPTAKQLAIINGEYDHSVINLSQTSSMEETFNNEVNGSKVIERFPNLFQGSPRAVTSMSCPTSPADEVTKSFFSQHVVENEQFISLSEATTPVISMRRRFDGSMSSSKHTVTRFNKSSDSKRIEHSRDDTVQTYLMVEVEDTGIGLSEQAMNHLFSPFQQAQRLAGGTGLGLYSLSQRMKALKGFYGVESRRDGRQGSMFWFAFPYRPDETMAQSRSSMKLSSVILASSNCASPSRKSMNRRSASTFPASHVRSVSSLSLERTNLKPASTANSFHVLLVDDSIPIQRMVSTMLRRNGYVVDIAENGVDCLEKVQRKLQSGESYDLILMDLQMPVMDGLETMRRLRTIETEKNLNKQRELSFSSAESPLQSFNKTSILRQLVVCISANADEENAEEGYLAGSDAIMPKPFTMDVLTKLLSKLDI
jgi:signal transduction histidine kinase/DNA-binding NarL/FixJ family response regulator